MHTCICASMNLCIYASMHLCISSSKERQERHANIGPNIKQARQTNIKICLKIIEICSKNHPNIDQHWSKNRPKWVQKSTKIGPKALLESSGGHLGPKMAPRANIGSKTWFVGPPWTSKLEAKIHQKSVRSWSKMWWLFYLFFGSIFGAIWCQLGSNLAPKTLPKWSQVGFKSHPKGKQAKS